MTVRFNTLEACDDAVRQGVLLLGDAIISYAEHGLNAKEIHTRVVGLGCEVSYSTVTRKVAKLREEEVIPQKTPAPRTIRLKEQQVREAPQERAQSSIFEQPCKETKPKPSKVKVTPCTVVEEIRDKVKPEEPRNLKVSVTKVTPEELEEARRESADNAISTGHEYGQQLVVARDELLKLKAKMKSISLYRGTAFLEEVREANPLAAKDLELLRECANLIIEIGEMARSSNGPEVLATVK